MKKNIKIGFVALAWLLLPCHTMAQQFNDYFVDKTLRIDYIFAGNVKQQMIAVDELNVMPHWYGKKQRLSEVPVEGNGQITVRDHHSGKVIYRNSFSTLSRNGSAILRLKRTPRVSRTSSSFRCQRIRWMSPSPSTTTEGK